MNDPLDVLWPLVDAPEPVVTAAVVTTWPDGVHQRLLDLGFIRQAEDADRVLCPECHAHEEEVIANDGPEGKPRFAIPCPEVYRADVPPEALRRWAVNLECLTAALTTNLGLSGRCSELSQGRLWRLGRTNWQGASRDVMLARGLNWDDAHAVRSAVVRGRRPIVFVARCRPPDNFWRGRVPPVLVLSQVTTLCDSKLEVDVMEVTAAIQDAETAATGTSVAVVSEEQLKLMIRQQVKAEEKTSLTDDVFTAAYRQCGSVRAAAAFLSEQTRQDVSKDQVHRALQRAGGVQAVLNDKDSDSIRRTVASHRRDRTGKPLHRTKPIEEE